MNSLTINFLALSRTTDIEISSDSIDIITVDLINLFAHKIDASENKIIFTILQNTPEFREQVNAFVQKYKSSNPAIHQFNSYFRDLEENEYFIFYPAALSTTDRNRCFGQLMALRNGEDPAVHFEATEALFGRLQAQYQMWVYGERTRNKIGERDKAKRVCRFCGKTSPEVSFKNEAHSISEALGNKKVITHDECDACNKFFDVTMERDLIRYLEVYRILFAVPGKNGIPTSKGKNYEITYSDTDGVKITHSLQEGEASKNDLSGSHLLLKTNHKITDQNLYKTLCKYALSVLDPALLPSVAGTIRWLRGEVILDQLPPVAQLTTLETLKKHPQMVLYVRKDGNTRLPYLVAEFQFALLTFVYIIPGSGKDTLDFTDQEDYERFWAFFKHYNGVPGWKLLPMDSRVAKYLDVDLHLIPWPNKTSDNIEE